MVTVGCVELVNDRILLAKVLKLFEDIESSSTAFTILFPSLPSPARIRRLVSGTRLYFILKELVDARAREGRTEEDPLQFLIDSGDTIPQMIEFIMSALVAGLLNSGINACCEHFEILSILSLNKISNPDVLAYLAQSPIDIARARAEINAVVAKYEAEEFFDDPSSLNLSEKVSRLPLDAWESEFPFLDNCLRDSIRLNASGTGFRKNVGEEMFIGDERIPSGAILVRRPPSTSLLRRFYRPPRRFLLEDEISRTTKLTSICTRFTGLPLPSRPRRPRDLSRPAQVGSEAI